jgi:hypothetical protein
MLSAGGAGRAVGKGETGGGAASGGAAGRAARAGGFVRCDATGAERRFVGGTGVFFALAISRLRR